MKTQENIKNSIKEDYSAQSVKNMPTKELGTVYKYMKFGKGAERIEKGDAVLTKKTRDLVGSELGKRARAGEEAAKRYLNDRMSNQIDKYGNKKKNMPLKKSQGLKGKIKDMLKGKMK